MLNDYNKELVFLLSETWINLLIYLMGKKEQSSLELGVEGLHTIRES